MKSSYWGKRDKIYFTYSSETTRRKNPQFWGEILWLMPQLDIVPFSMGCVWKQEGHFLRVWKHNGKMFSKLSVCKHSASSDMGNFLRCISLHGQPAVRFVFLPAAVKEQSAVLAGCVTYCKASLQIQPQVLFLFVPSSSGCSLERTGVGVQCCCHSTALKLCFSGSWCSCFMLPE